MNKKFWFIVLGIILIAGIILLLVSKNLSNTSSLKEYSNSVYSIKYPSTMTLEEKTAIGDNGNYTYTLLNSTDNTGISLALLLASPTSIKDLEFDENLINGPHFVQTQKVTYGILDGYQEIQNSTYVGQEAMIINIFDKEHGYWVKYEIDYAASNPKAKENAIQITQDILGNFKYI